MKTSVLLRSACVTFVCLFGVIVSTIVPTAAQQTSTALWKPGTLQLGVNIGMSEVNSMLTYGVQAHYILTKDNMDYGPGALGIKLNAFRYSGLPNSTITTTNVTAMPIAVLGTYNLFPSFQDKRLNLFLAAGFGIRPETVKNTVSNVENSQTNSFFAGEIGVQYLLDRNLGIQASLGMGTHFLTAGVFYHI